MEGSPETIFEEKEDLMVSGLGGGDGGSNPTMRTAYFLQPTATPPVLDPPSHCFSSMTTPCRNFPLRVQFPGWARLPLAWNSWVSRLQSSYESLWKQVGIYEAVMLSTYEFSKHIDLIVGLGEKWCPDTNTFIFPWGEATITLEDIMVNGGYSPLGEPVSPPPMMTESLKEAEQHLIEARRKLAVQSGDCCHYTSYRDWLADFMRSGKEFEHEAFLSFWLSKFVLPNRKFYGVGTYVFRLAILLARGKQIALAPAVLSSIYRELGLLKGKLLASSKSKTKTNIYLYAPFQFVQVWAWERFSFLRPSPKAIVFGEPRAARWCCLRKLISLGNVRLALDKAGKSFQWRPYATPVENWSFPKFYGDKEQRISVAPHIDKEFLSFLLCVRGGELVGLDSIQQYLPHRVAMQFGFDQDVPGHFGRCNGGFLVAWSNYDRPINDAKLYIPPRLVQGNVTLRYLEWWKKPSLALRDPNELRREQATSSEESPPPPMRKEIDNHVSVCSIVPLGQPQPEAENTENGSKVTVNENGNGGVIKDFHVEIFSGSECPGTQTSAGDDIALGDMEGMAEEGIVLTCQPQSISGSIAEREVAKGIKRKENIRSDGESSSNWVPEVPGTQLEARIERIEKIITELKAARTGNGVQ